VYTGSQHPARRVLIVDDSAMLRQRLEALLNEAAGITIVGQADDVESAVALIGDTKPDAVILDLALRSGSGLDVLMRVRGIEPRPTMIVLTNYPHDEYRSRCLALGANAFLDKAAEFERVLTVLLASHHANDTVDGRLRDNPAPDAPPARASFSIDRVLGVGPAVLFVLRIEGDTLIPEWTTPNLERVTGFTPEESMSTTWHARHVHPEDLPGVASTLTRLYAYGSADYRYRFRHKNGEWIWLRDELVLIRDRDGRPVEIVGAMLNITDRIQAREALAEREERYRILAEATSDAIVILENGMVREINRPFVELFEYSANDLVGRPALDFVAPESRALAAANIASATATTTELQLLTKSGCRRVVAATARMHHTGGRDMRLVALQDLTERRELEAQFHQAQKLEAVGRLASVVAHDFNNVLTAILGSVELAGQSLPSEHPALADMQDAMAAVQQGSDLARQLLGFSRRQEPDRGASDVNAVVSEDEHLMQRMLGKGIRLSLSLTPGLPTVALSPGQLRQVLMNLVINARDAMPHGGTLTVETSGARVDGCIPAPMLPGPYVRVVVRDTGVGMDAHVLSRIFEPFFTTKAQKGTGLGLASVYGLVTNSGGLVSVRSAPDQGAEFELLIPAAVTIPDELVEPMPRAAGPDSPTTRPPADGVGRPNHFLCA